MPLKIVEIKKQLQLQYSKQYVYQDITSQVDIDLQILPCSEEPMIPTPNLCQFNIAIENGQL